MQPASAGRHDVVQRAFDADRGYGVTGLHKRSIREYPSLQQSFRQDIRAPKLCRDRDVGFRFCRVISTSELDVSNDP